MISVANPVLEGPITANGVPFISSTNFDLSEVGYTQNEYFMSGSANAYISSNSLTSDGLWDVELADEAEDYKTRIMVYRPIDEEAFNGTVIIEWLNVSGGLDAAPDWILSHTELIRQGYAWVGVSAQLMGIDGGGGFSLKTINSERYGTLNHPGDSFSYDIFSQAAQAIRFPQGISPLSNFAIERIIAAGESQSASRLMTYLNAIAPKVDLFDGYFVHSRLGGAAPLSQQPQTDIAGPTVVQVREDLDLPVMMLQTESDLFLLGAYADRQDDNENFRLWEVAGTAHADAYTTNVGFADRGNDLSVADIQLITSPVPGIIDCDKPINSGPQHFVVKAAISALNHWIRSGEAPAMAPRLAVAGDPPALQLDQFGNAKGGIRTSYVDAPIATLSGQGQSGGGFCFLMGTTELFDQAVLANLYPDHTVYVNAVSEATDRAVAEGFILEIDGKLIKAAAQASDIGKP